MRGHKTQSKIKGEDRRRIDLATASLKDQFAITYRSLCIGGRLAVTFDVKAIDNPRIAPAGRVRLGTTATM